MSQHCATALQPGQQSKTLSQKKKKVPLNKNKIEEFAVLDIKTHDEMMVIKIVWYWFRDRQADLWNIIENPETELHISVHLIYDICDIAKSVGNKYTKNH